jgi:hypothetical protein
MAKVFIAASMMWVIYTVLASYGALETATLITGAMGSGVAVWFGFARG